MASGEIRKVVANTPIPIRFSSKYIIETETGYNVLTGDILKQEFNYIQGLPVEEIVYIYTPDETIVKISRDYVWDEAGNLVQIGAWRYV